MKGYTREEFVNYVKNLEFDELDDAANFVTEYFSYFESIPKENKEEKDAAWEKWVILMSKFGMMFVTFTSEVIAFRKRLNDELKATEESENPSGAALESGTK